MADGSNLVEYMLPFKFIETKPYSILNIQIILISFTFFWPTELLIDTLKTYHFSYLELINYKDFTLDRTK